MQPGRYSCCNFHSKLNWYMPFFFLPGVTSIKLLRAKFFFLNLSGHFLSFLASAVGICLCLAAPPLLSIFGRPFSYKCSQCRPPWTAAPGRAKQRTKLNFNSLLAFQSPASFWIAAGETDEALFASCFAALWQGKAGHWDRALAGLWRHYSPSFSLGLSDSLHS